MFPLVLDEVTHDIVERLPLDVVTGQNIPDRVGNPAQTLAFILMLRFEIADAFDGNRVTRLQLLKDHVLFRMMAAIRIVLKITDDRLYNFIIGPLIAINHT